MKKLVLTALAPCLLSLTSVAQEAPVVSATPGLKATAGMYSLEANINLFGGGGNTVRLSNSLEQIRFRYFMSDDMALRLGANLSIHSRTDNPNDDTEIKRSHFGISIMPGIEKHFAGTERLSPYVGAELGIGIDSRKQETTFDGNKEEIKGQWEGGPRGHFQFGLNAVAGFDFYFARNIYFGYELGFGLAVRSESKIENNGEEVAGKSSSFELGPNVRNGIRVGYVF